MRTVKQEWDDYYNDVMKVSGIEVNSVQYIETRRAFYAGFFSMLAITSKLGDPEVTEDEGIKQLEMLNKELKRFAINVKLGVK